MQAVAETVCGLCAAGHLRALSSPRRHRTLLRWSGEVGPVFLLRMLWGRMVVVADSALAAPLFKRSLGATKVQEVKSFDEVCAPRRAYSTCWAFAWCTVSDGHLLHH